MDEITQEAIELMESTEVLDNTALLETLIELNKMSNNLLTLIATIVLFCSFPILKGVVTSWFKL